MKLYLSYFSEHDVNHIIKLVVNYLISSKIEKQCKYVRCRCWFKILQLEFNKLIKYLSNASFYAMDITPIMLKIILKKTAYLM